MRILLSAYACRPNVGSEPGCGWNWATHLAARGIEVHALVAKRKQEPIEAGLRLNPVPNLHFTYVPVPYDWAKKSEAVHYMCWQIAALNAAREIAGGFNFSLRIMSPMRVFMCLRNCGAWGFLWYSGLWAEVRPLRQRC